MSIVPVKLRRDRWEDLPAESVQYMIEANIVNSQALTDAAHPHIVPWWEGKLSSVLDAPCGLCGYYDLLMGLGFRKYRGIDISGEMIRAAKELHPEVKRKVKVGDVFALDYEDNEFGLVHSMNLMIHLENWIDALVELWRVGRHMHFDIYVADEPFSCHGVFCDTLRMEEWGRFSNAVSALPDLRWWAAVELRDVELKEGGAWRKGKHVLCRLEKK